MSMPAEVKSEWITALRSGAYEQGQRSLRQQKLSPNGEGYIYTYCCLGVLCDLFAKKGKGRWDSSQSLDTFVISAPAHWTIQDFEAANLDPHEIEARIVTSAMYVPRPLAEELGLLRPGEELHTTEKSSPQSILSNMNDGTTSGGETIKPASFEEIATWIGENL